MRVVEAKFVAAAEQVSGLPAPAFAEVAFLGRSNVGKSSLINRLVGRKNLVRTSGTPGCTRAINVFRIDLQGASAENKAVLDLVDLPGFGYARRSKAERASWGPLVEGFLRQRAGLRAVVLLMDLRRGLQAEEAQLMEFLAPLPLTCLCVATKIDKIPSNKRKPEIQKVQRDIGQRVFPTSAETGDGTDVLFRKMIETAAITLG